MLSNAVEKKCCRKILSKNDVDKNAVEYVEKSIIKRSIFMSNIIFEFLYMTSLYGMQELLTHLA